MAREGRKLGRKQAERRQDAGEASGAGIGDGEEIRMCGAEKCCGGSERLGGGGRKRGGREKGPECGGDRGEGRRGGDEYCEGGPVLRNVRSDKFGGWRFSAFTRGTFVGNREIFAAPARSGRRGTGAGASWGNGGNREPGFSLTPRKNMPRVKRSSSRGGEEGINETGEYVWGTAAAYSGYGENGKARGSRSAFFVGGYGRDDCCCILHSGGGGEFSGADSVPEGGTGGARRGETGKEGKSGRGADVGLRGGRRQKGARYGRARASGAGSVSAGFPF